MATPWSRTIFRVSFGGNDVSDRLRPFLISLEVQDKAGSVSDTARIVVDDTGGRFALPQKGDPVSIALGTLGRGVVPRFEGTVDTVRSRLDRGGGLTLEIAAKGLDTTSPAKQPNQKHADDKTLGDVAGEFGKSGGLPGGIEVHSSLASIRRPYWSMDDESVIAWGQRVAAEVGATFKVVGQKGVMVPRSSGLSASGKSLVAITVQRGANLISADIAPQIARPEYQRVRARWYDTAEARWKEKEVEVEGSGGSSGGGSSARQSLRFTRPDEDEADRVAGAEGKDSEREKGGGRVDIDGEPMALAECPVVVSGVRPGVDGQYTAETVTDKVSRQQGYVTTIDIVRPEASSSGGGGSSGSGNTGSTTATGGGTGAPAPRFFD